MAPAYVEHATAVAIAAVSAAENEAAAAATPRNSSVLWIIELTTFSGMKDFWVEVAIVPRHLMLQKQSLSRLNGMSWADWD